MKVMQTYVNPISAGQDPFVLRGPDGMYYSVFSGSTNARGMFVAQSPRISEPGVARLVWSTPAEGWNSGAIWAPEIHYLRGRYYIYYTTAAMNCGVSAWPTRRLGVLEAEAPLGPYRDAGKLELGDEMSIDGTVLEAADGQLYFVYMRNLCFGDRQNSLYIAPMASPTEISGEPRLLSQPQWPWEEYVNEGPEAIRHNGRLMIVYSAHAAHTPEYCLALLTCENEADILSRDSWTKHDAPCFRKGNGVIGPGHASMTIAPDGKTHYLVYHCKSNACDNFLDSRSMWRMVCVQPFVWREDNTPCFGAPLPLGEPLPLPPGEPEDQRGTVLDNAIRSDNDWIIHYGAHEHAPIVEDILYMDACERPEYGCKSIVRGLCWDDARLAVDLRMIGGEGSGLLLRVRNAGARRNLMQGYAARISQRFGLQLLRYDGWGEPVRLGHIALKTLPGDWLRLEVQMEGDAFTLRVGDTVLTVRDAAYASGRVGIMAEGDMGWFKNLHVEALTP